MRKFLFALLLSVMPFAAHAEWVAGAGFYNLSDDEGGIDVSLNAIAVSLGYRFDSETNFTVMPELRVGFGIGDDTVSGVKVEIDQLLALSVRGQYDFESGVYLFGAPSYANLDLKASAGGFSASADDWEFGVGGGVGYNFSGTTTGEISYETYDGTDTFGVSFRVGFE